VTSEAKARTGFEESFWSSDALRNLQRVSEARGLTFYFNPPREVVPDFLGNFRPDAIARGPEGGIIFEVKSRRSMGAERQLAEIAKKVSGQKGWEFRAIYLNESTEPAPTITKPTPQQLKAAFDEVEALLAGGHRAAAFTAAWAVLEALARLASADDETRAAKPFSPLQAVQALAEEGYIENDVADRFRSLVKMRNAVSHGDLSIEVPAEQVQDLLRELKAVASAIEATAPPAV